MNLRMRMMTLHTTEGEFFLNLIAETMPPVTSCGNGRVEYFCFDIYMALFTWKWIVMRP